MNKNEQTQNNNKEKKEKKKSFLSSLIQVEDNPEQKRTEPKSQIAKNKEVQQQEAQDKSEEQLQQQTESEKQKLVEPTKKEDKEKPKKTKETQKEKPEEDKNGLTEEEKLLLRTGEGVNLIPKKSKAEIKKEKKKFSFSLSSILSLIVLIILSLGIVFFNILSKQQLNSAKEQLYSREAELGEYTDKIISNEAIVERIDLYKHLQQGVFSPKEILQYVMRIVNRAGNITIRSFDLGNDLDFEMSGSTSDLAVVAKLWYLLGIDDNIITINLESVGKNKSGVNFSFKGELNSENFVEN
jgi:hypothetical protein